MRMSETPQDSGEHLRTGPAFRAHPTHWVVPDEDRLRAESLPEGIPLFREVPPHHLRELARFARSESFAAGDVIFRMGEPGSTLHVVKSGRVRVVRDQEGGP